MTSLLDCSDQELIDQLRQLNYSNISEESLQKFKKELNEIAHLRSASEVPDADIKSTPLSQANVTPNYSALSLLSGSVAPMQMNSQMENRISSGISRIDETPTTASFNSRKEISSQRLPDMSSTLASTGRPRRPLVRKIVKKMNGKSMIFTESRSSGITNLSFTPGNITNISNNHSPSSFEALTPYTSSTDSSKSCELSSFNYSTPQMDVNENLYPSPFTSSSVSSIVRKPRLRKMSRSSIISIEKIPRDKFDMSTLANSVSSIEDSRSVISETSTIPNDISIKASSLKRSRSYDDISIIKYPSKSFIRSASHMSRSLRKKKTDPVQRYHEYKQFWEAYKAPGEKSHKNLRWMIREHMLSDPSRNVPMREILPSLTNQGFPIPWRS